jgi:hypothetical protein
MRILALEQELKPLVQEGCIRFELVPLVPYDGYARLFAH